MSRTVGVVESHSYADVLGAANRMVRAADIRLVRCEKVGEGALALVVEGDTADVQLALAAAKDGHDGTNGNGLRAELLAHVPGEVLSVLSLPGGHVWDR